MYITFCTVASGVFTGLFVGILTKRPDLGSFAGVAVLTGIFAIVAAIQDVMWAIRKK